MERMETTLSPAERNALATNDPFLQVTPSELRRHVLAALRERAAIGDKLAEGAVKVIVALEQQANNLAWEIGELGGEM